MEHVVSAGNVGIDLITEDGGDDTDGVRTENVYVYAYSSGRDMMKLISQVYI
jgi:hypothetical protein